MQIKKDEIFKEIVLPTILLSIAISIGYSIHIFTFYKRHKRETGKRKESVIFAMEETGWPLLFTGLTTISALLSFMIALCIIVILLMLVFGSIKTGLIGLIPNIAPAITVGGIMGFMDIPLDSMTVTIIPMILGLAVDDTIHFFNHGRLEFERTGNYRKSIINTFGTVGVALVLTTLILSANFLTYTTSVANMFINLGVLAAAGMLAALLADFFITPILFKQFNIFGEEKIYKRRGAEKKLKLCGFAALRSINL